jgi:hypothetical protein
MNYYDDDNNNNSKINTLLSYYKSNNDKIAELKITNTLLQKEVTSLMREKFYTSILTNISESEYSNITKYINKTIKRGDEKYKSTKTLYDFILKELQTISTDIKSIKNIIVRVGNGYRTIAMNLIFDIGDNEYELCVPMPQKITVDDVFHSDYIDMDVNKFQLYIHSSKVSWTRIWVGEDIGQISNDIPKGDNV